jgi:hypothetical protein
LVAAATHHSASLAALPARFVDQSLATVPDRLRKASPSGSLLSVND